MVDSYNSYRCGIECSCIGGDLTTFKKLSNLIKAVLNKMLYKYTKTFLNLQFHIH